MAESAESFVRQTGPLLPQTRPLRYIPRPAAPGTAASGSTTLLALSPVIVSEFIERRIGSLTIRIDRHLCVGFGDCITEADELFELDDDGIVAFKDPPDQDEARALRACRSCPVDALVALNADGIQLAP